MNKNDNKLKKEAKEKQEAKMRELSNEEAQMNDCHRWSTSK